jgi:hypothetical protein
VQFWFELTDEPNVDLDFVFDERRYRWLRFGSVLRKNVNIVVVNGRCGQRRNRPWVGANFNPDIFVNKRGQLRCGFRYSRGADVNAIVGIDISLI